MKGKYSLFEAQCLLVLNGVRRCLYTFYEVYTLYLYVFASEFYAGASTVLCISDFSFSVDLLSGEP